MIEITHHILSLDEKTALIDGTDINPEFYGILIKKYIKFWMKYRIDYLVYSHGKDTLTGIEAISIVHPWDTFKPKIAREIIRGRIKRMKGELNRAPYDPVPDYIFVPEIMEKPKGIEVC